MPRWSSSEVGAGSLTCGPLRISEKGPRVGHLHHSKTPVDSSASLGSVAVDLHFAEVRSRRLLWTNGDEPRDLPQFGDGSEDGGWAGP